MRQLPSTLLLLLAFLSGSVQAQATGFGNVSHFSKVFEEQFGINPKTYME